MRGMGGNDGEVEGKRLQQFLPGYGRARIKNWRLAGRSWNSPDGSRNIVVGRGRQKA